jgi:exosortase/archaeosortase family protein
MAGWFFGELFRLRWPRRIALVVGALVAAVAVNWLRTSALTWIAAAEGVAASEAWHDRVGAAELVVTLALVVLLAWRMARGGTARVSSVAAADAAALRWRGPAALALAGAVAAAGAPAAWYGGHEWRAQAAEIQWTLQPPADDWRPVALPARVRELLQPSTLTGVSREEPGRGRSLAYLVTWDGDVARAAAAEAHDPTICLPAAGLRPTLAAEPVAVEIDGVRVEFSEAAFAGDGREQRIFYCHWDAWLGRARAPQPAEIADVAAWRLARVAAGRRRGDAAYLVLVTPADDERAARAWLQTWAPRLYRRR